MGRYLIDETVPPAQGYITGLQAREAPAGAAAPAARKSAPVPFSGPAPKNANPAEAPKKKGLLERFKGLFK